MIEIANPIYDVVFKYLMKDEKLAKLLLSAIIGKEVVGLELRPTEHSLSVSETLTVLRLDFRARIVDREGRQELVLIELQKAKMAGDIMRFRRYLGGQYANKENVVRETQGEYTVQRALPILSIYFLGEPLPKVKAPVVRVNRVYTDAATGEELHEREEFIESLTHDSIVIQVRYLQGNRRNELEQLLSIFDQSQVRTRNPHLLWIDEQALPKRYRPVLRKLQQAMANANIRETMEAEDEVVAELQELERQVAEKDAVIEEKDQTIRRQQEQLALAVRNAHAAGLDIPALAAIFRLPESEVRALMVSFGEDGDWFG